MSVCVCVICDGVCREGERRSGGRKTRRIARSQIPSKPVEMPGGESLDLQVELTCAVFIYK